MSENLIQPLPGRLERALQQALPADEAILVKLKGNFKEALVCTTKRVLIVKGGLMAGQFFGTNIFQVTYPAIASVEVKFSLLTGYFELSSAGMQNTSKNYWSNAENKSPARAPNCVSLGSRRQAHAFNLACSWIMAKVAEARNPEAATPKAANGDAHSTFEEDMRARIELLGQMVDQGILTPEEFNQKKQELLSRL